MSFVLCQYVFPSVSEENISLSLSNLLYKAFIARKNHNVISLTRDGEFSINLMNSLEYSKENGFLRKTRRQEAGDRDAITA